MNKLVLQPRPEYLYAYIEGNVDSYEIALEHWREIADELSKRNLNRVLVHQNILAELSDVETYRIATALQEIGLFGVKIGVVDDDPKHKILTEFGVLVGSNRGLMVQSFSTAEAAEDWLLCDRRQAAPAKGLSESPQ